MPMTNVKNRILKAMLIKFKIDDEELLYENEETIICTRSNINEKTKVTFFITDCRTGFVTNSGAFYFTDIKYVRNMNFKDNNSVDLVLTSEDNIYYYDKDYVIEIIDSDNYDKLDEALFDILYYRIQNPMKNTYDLFRKSIEFAYEYKFKEALDKLDEIAEADQLNRCSELLKVKLYSAIGEEKKAELLVANRYRYFTNFNVFIFVELILRIKWDVECLKYLPAITDKNSISNLCLKYINYIVYDHMDKASDTMLLISKELIKYNDLHSTILLNILYIAKYINEKNKNNLINLKNFTVKMIMILKSKYRESEKKNLCEQLEEMLENLIDNPLKTVIQQNENLKSSLIAEEKYDEVIESKFVGRELEVPQSFSAQDIMDIEFVDNEVAFCEYFIYRVFSELRSDACRAEELLMKLNNLNNILKKQDNRFFKVKDCEESLLLYYIIASEIYILNGRRREALKLNIEFKKQAKVMSDVIISELAVYSVEIAQFYEAYALDSLCEMKKCISKIPAEKVSWIHKIYNDKLNSKTKIETEDAAIDCINDMIRRFKSLINEEDIIDDNSRQLIEESIETIENKLEDDELRIAIVGETSAGKTTFLNSMFHTDLFFATQEEATGVATEIRRGSKIEIEVVDKDDNIRSAYNTDRGSWFNQIIEDEDNENKEKSGLLGRLFNKKNDYNAGAELELSSMTPQEFVAKHTKVGEESLEWVSKVRVRLPIDNLPENVVIVDTPGFNANDKRTEIAKEQISNAHVCLFLIDARNALKKKEMEILNLVEDEAGRVFFVLNKMDSVTYDEDLDDEDDDCDINEMISNVSEKLVDRVTEGIREHLEIDKVKVYTVTSIYRESYADKIKEFYNNIEIVKQDIFDESSSKKLDLIIDMAAKEAIKFSKIIENINDEIVSKLEDEEKKLIETLPSDPKFFKSYIEDKVFNKLYNLRSDYIDKLGETIKNEFILAADKYKTWLQNVTEKNELKQAQFRAEQIIEAMAEEIEEVKNEELSKISDEILSEIIAVFNELYNGLSFKASFNSNDILEYSSNLNLNMSSNIRNINGSTFGNSTAQIVCAGIGMMFGPIGALVGGFIGSALFGTTIDDVKEKVWDAFYNAVSETHDSIIDACDNDLDVNNHNSFMNRFFEIIDSQILKYEGTIKNKILVTNNYLTENNNIMFKFKEKAFRINDEIYLLKEWRMSRN